MRNQFSEKQRFIQQQRTPAGLSVHAKRLVNPSFTLNIQGPSEENSRDLLEEIYAHRRRPEFQQHFHLQNGSIAFWDNRATWHYAYNDYHGHRREMHRITIEGTALS